MFIIELRSRIRDPKFSDFGLENSPPISFACVIRMHFRFWFPLKEYVFIFMALEVGPPKRELRCRRSKAELAIHP
jgi:hypothetical protein